MPEARNIPPITIATRLRLAREWRELDQQQIADELGISRATVSNYETGKTKPGKMALNAWAVVVDVDVDWLKTGVETTGPDDTTPGEVSEKLQFDNLQTNVTHVDFAWVEQIAA